MDSHVIYPFLVTFSTIFLGLIFTSMVIITDKKYLQKINDLFLIVIYYGLCHVMFSIQARYTILTVNSSTFDIPMVQILIVKIRLIFPGQKYYLKIPLSNREVLGRTGLAPKRATG